MKARVNNMRRPMIAVLKKFQRDEDGATAIEYSLIVALIFIVIAGAIKQFANSTSDMYTDISDGIQNR